MSTDPARGDQGAASPDEVFAVLGEETRLRILRELGAAERPLAFSELFDRIDYPDSSNFGYHLDKLVGHFVRKTDEGYDLWQAGSRVVQAVLSGVVTDVPVLEPTEVDRPCPFCSENVEVAFRQEQVVLHCSNCSGMFEERDSGEDGFDDFGNLGVLLLPPAGVHERAPDAVLRAAEIWTATELQAVAEGVCRRCSAPVDHSTEACAAHDATGGQCEACGHRFGSRFTATCTTCPFHIVTPLVTPLAARSVVKGFLIEHGIDPISTEAFVFMKAAVEETIRSTDPLEVHFSLSADGDTLEVTMDEELSVVEVNREPTPAASET